MSWVKLERGNDWGYEYFSLPGKSKTQHGTCDSKNALKYTEGGRIVVKWGNGVLESVDIVHRQFSDRVNDHGHSYDVAYTLPGFEASHRGTVQWYPLDAVEVWVE